MHKLTCIKPLTKGASFFHILREDEPLKVVQVDDEEAEKVLPPSQPLEWDKGKQTNTPSSSRYENLLNGIFSSDQSG